MNLPRARAVGAVPEGAQHEARLHERVDIPKLIRLLVVDEQRRGHQVTLCRLPACFKNRQVESEYLRGVASATYGCDICVWPMRVAYACDMYAMYGREEFRSNV